MKEDNENIKKRLEEMGKLTDSKQKVQESFKIEGEDAAKIQGFLQATKVELIEICNGQEESSKKSTQKISEDIENLKNLFDSKINDNSSEISRINEKIRLIKNELMVKVEKSAFEILVSQITQFKESL